MITVIRHSISRYKGQIIIWGIALAVLCAYGLLLYDSLVKPDAQLQFEQLIANYPPELMTFFGDMSQMFSPDGYLDTLFFSYIPIIIGFFSIVSCALLLAGDEEKGFLDLVLAHPINRAQLFFGRVISFLLATLIILSISWLGCVVTLPTTSMQTTLWQILLPFLSLYALLMFLGTLALLLSMLFPSQQWATLTTGLILVASYFLTSLSRLSEDLRPVEKFFPMHYYQGGQALTNMNWGWFGLLVGSSVIFILLSWWFFEHRDIRISGESRWRITSLWEQKRLGKHKE